MNAPQKRQRAAGQVGCKWVVRLNANGLSSPCNYALISLYVVFFPLSHHNPEIIGRWETDYSYPITGGTLSFKGMTTYLHEGKYNVGGVISLEGEVKQQSFKFSYNVTGAGTWTTDDDLLSISLISLKSHPKSINLAGIDFSPELVATLSGQPILNLENNYPSGTSDEFRVQSPFRIQLPEGPWRYTLRGLYAQQTY
ncbi:hypothetical protein J2Y88_004303 [Pseudomonas chlororaphis]|nr:hypothetical protein [Pseudomonas chlororaphis]